jgi:hypothetical protein
MIMAEERKANSGDEEPPPQDPLAPDPLFADALADPNLAGSGDLVVLEGYLGASPDGDMVRLYLNVAMDEYYLIHREDVLRRMQPKEGSVGTTSLLWLCKSTRIRRVRVGEAGHLHAEFLCGPIDRRRECVPRPVCSSPGPFMAEHSQPASWDCPASWNGTRYPCKCG